MLSELLTNWTIHANKLTTLITLVLIIAMNLAVGILPHVNNYAHLGGFITGFFLGFIVLVRLKYGWINHKSAPPGYFVPALPKSKYKTYQYVLFELSLILLIAGFAVGLVSLLQSVDEMNTLLGVTIWAVSLPLSGNVTTIARLSIRMKPKCTRHT